MKPSNVTKVKAGLYRHEPTGRYIVHTSGWEGPRGGNRRRWELAERDAHGNLSIDEFSYFGTLRDAAVRLDAERGKSE